MVPCTESTLGWSLAIFGDVSIHLTVEALLKLMIPVIPAAGMIFTTKDQSSADSSVGSPVIVEFDYQCRRLEHLILYLLRAY